MGTDKDELTVINGPPLIPPTKRLKGYPTTLERRKMGVKSLQCDLRRQIMRWDWHFQLRWTGKIQP